MTMHTSVIRLQSSKCSHNRVSNFCPEYLTVKSLSLSLKNSYFRNRDITTSHQREKDTIYMYVEVCKTVYINDIECFSAVHSRPDVTYAANGTLESKNQLSVHNQV